MGNGLLGPGAGEELLKRGVEEFIDANLVDFVVGHVWQRPGLTRRARRIITVQSFTTPDLDDLLARLDRHTADHPEEPCAALAA